MEREQLVAAVDVAIEKSRRAEKALDEARENFRKFDAAELIRRHNLRKSMVVHMESSCGWIGTLEKWLEWIRKNRPDAKWYEFNGWVYETGREWNRDYVESNPLRYDELPE